MANPFSIGSEYRMANGPSHGQPGDFYPATPISTIHSSAEQGESENCTILSANGAPPLEMEDMMSGFDFDAQSGDYNDAELSRYLNDLLSGPRFGVY